MRFIIILLIASLCLNAVGELFAQTPEEKYNSAITKGKQYFEEKDYINAKILYQYASDIKPGELFPKGQLKKLIRILRDQRKRSAGYAAFMLQAEKLTEEKKFDEAISKYKQALQIMPEKQYPLQKINKIKQLQKENAEKIKEYDDAIKQADDLLKEEKYKEALDKFREALSIFPDRSYPSEKINVIERIINEQEQRQNNYEICMRNADFFLNKKDYETALSEYEKAHEIFPDKAQPREKISELNKIIKKNDAYTKIIEEADQLYIIKDYTKAKEKYTEASEIFTDKNYPGDMIEKIDEKLAMKTTTEEEDYDNAIDQGYEFLEAKNYKMAKRQFGFAARLKPDNGEPRKKLEEIQAILDKYNELITNADKLYNKQEYEKAKEEYVKASEILTDEDYPVERIDEINSVISRLAKEQEQIDSYDRIIAQADSLYHSGAYKLAKETYNEALTYLPDEKYPDQQISKINLLVKELRDKKEIQEQYTKLIKEADRSFEEKKYNIAKLKYQEASKVKEDEQYPRQKLEEINQIIKNLAEYKKNREQYENIIADADKLLKKDKLEDAKEKYNAALEIFPSENYPKKQINTVDSIFESLRMQAEIERKYDEAIQNAEKYLDLEDYENAKKKFEIALSLKPDERYPKKEIDDLNEILEEIEKQKELEIKYQCLIDTAENNIAEEKYEEAKAYFEKAMEIKPGQDSLQYKIVEAEKKIEEQRIEKQKAYEKEIAKADSLLDAEKYKEAMLCYKMANELVPDEQYPKEKIDDCNSILDAIERKIEQDYNSAIGRGDKLFQSKSYDRAMSAYSEAAKIKPGEPYPKEMIARITKIIDENVIADINKKPVQVNSNNEKRFSFEPIPIQDRKDNFILVKFKNLNSKELRVFLNYGAANTKNGGILIRVPADEKYHDYIIRIGSQYKWFSENNDWIGLYPAGGDLEVGLIRISKSE